MQHQSLIKSSILIGLLIIAIVALTLTGHIPQNLDYHNFADDRHLLGIKNFQNVISNLPFLLIGVYGLTWMYQQKQEHFVSPKEKIFYYIYLIAISFVAFGSSYYHWNPNNNTLVWDRLPMTVAFMSFFSAMLAERISLKLGLYALPALLIFGVLTIVYWHYSELAGHGDLRPYLLVQFYPMLAVPLMLLIYRSKYTATHYLWYALGFYACAKALEIFDVNIYHLSNAFVGGHALKHVVAAISAYCILLYVQYRKPAIAFTQSKID